MDKIILLIIALISLILCAVFYNLYLITEKYPTLFHVLIFITFMFFMVCFIGFTIKIAVI